MRVIHDTEFPNSVEATQQLLDRQGGEYERLKVRALFCVVFGFYIGFWISIKGDISEAGRHGELLLGDFRAKNDSGKEFSERNGNVSTTERYVCLN